MPVEIVWSPLARARLREIHAFVALGKPEAVRHLATRIVAMVETLRLHPHLGRAGAELGIRELVIGGTPYSILYRVRGQRVIYQYDLVWGAGQVSAGWARRTRKYQIQKPFPPAKVSEEPTPKR